MQTFAFAQTPSEDAVKLTETILALPSDRPTVIDTSKEYVNRSIRNQLSDRLAGRNDDNIDTLLAKARTLNLENVDLYQAFAHLRQHKIVDFKNNAEYQRLITASTSSDWKRANFANSSLALHTAAQKNNLPALAFAQAALAQIPKDKHDLEIGDIMFDTYDVLITVFIYDRNIQKAVEATKRMVDYGIQSGHKIDRIGTVYNLSVLFAQSRDYETATKISSLLVTQAKNTSKYHQALANLGHGKNLIAMKRYSEAIPFLLEASEFAPGTLIDTSAKAKLALGYAHIRQPAKAKILEQFLQQKIIEEPGLKSRLVPMTQEIKAEIAVQDGDYKKALSIYKEWATAQIEQLEALSDQDRREASKQLAVNEQVAQANFKNLQETTKLQGKIIVQERRLRYALIGLLGALTLIIIMLVRARRKQIKVNQQLGIAAEKAMAGEQVKSRFLAVISHELRTPMNPIIALSQILVDRTNTLEDRKLLSLILLSAENLMTMIENIVSVADNAGGDTLKVTEQIELRSFLTQTVKPFYTQAKQKGIMLELRIDRSVENALLSSKFDLKLILNNLLSNAVKFTAKGFISVRVSPSLDQDDTILIAITDSGIGMDEAEIPHLLTAFEQRDSSFTREYGGAGIGLYVAHKKAKLIGASMTIQSEQNQGTCIKLSLPLGHETPAMLAA